MLITASKKRRRKRDLPAIEGSGPHYTFVRDPVGNGPGEWGMWDKVNDLFLAGKYKDYKAPHDTLTKLDHNMTHMHFPASLR